MNVFKSGGKTASQESSSEITTIASIYTKGIPMMLGYIYVESKSQRANKKNTYTVFLFYTVYTYTIFLFYVSLIIVLQKYQSTYGQSNGEL